MSEEAKFRWKCVGLVALGVGMIFAKTYFGISESIPYPQKIAWELTERTGDALIIAVVLGFLVDLSAKKETIKETLLEISGHIIGRHLPKEIREEVLEYLSKSFFRPCMHLEYSLDLASWDAHTVVLQTTCYGDIQNLSAKRSVFELSVEMDDTSLHGKKSQIDRIAIGIHGGDYFDKQFDERANAELEAKFGTRRFSVSMPIPTKPPKPVQTNLQCTEYLPTSYIYPFVCTTAIMGRVELRIFDNKNQFDVEVNLSSDHDEKMRRIDCDNGTIWHIETPLLPGQCIFTKWQKRRDPASIQQNQP